MPSLLLRFLSPCSRRENSLKRRAWRKKTGILSAADLLRVREAKSSLRMTIQRSVCVSVLGFCYPHPRRCALPQSSGWDVP